MVMDSPDIVIENIESSEIDINLNRADSAILDQSNLRFMRKPHLLMLSGGRLAGFKITCEESEKLRLWKEF